MGRQTPRSANVAGRERLGEDDWRDVELLASQMVTETESADARQLPLIAVCGRPNVGKSTLFNRLTGSRRSIVGDEPGITRDRIYGEIEWMGQDARIVDTGGVVPDDEALIPSEIFRQAQVALDEADAIVMVVDGRTELASPDMELCSAAAAWRQAGVSGGQQDGHRGHAGAGGELPAAWLQECPADLGGAWQRHRRPAG